MCTRRPRLAVLASQGNLPCAVSVGQHAACTSASGSPLKVTRVASRRAVTGKCNFFKGLLNKLCSPLRPRRRVPKRVLSAGSLQVLSAEQDGQEVCASALPPAVWAHGSSTTSLSLGFPTTITQEHLLCPVSEVRLWSSNSIASKF